MGGSEVMESEAAEEETATEDREPRDGDAETSELRGKTGKGIQAEAVGKEAGAQTMRKDKQGRTL